MHNSGQLGFNIYIIPVQEISYGFCCIRIEKCAASISL